MKLPGDERDAVIGGEEEQLLLFESFLGLSTGTPATEGLLAELTSRASSGEQQGE